MIEEAAITTLKASAMVLWMVFGASILVGFYILKGGQDFVTVSPVATGLGSQCLSEKLLNHTSDM